MYVSWKLRSEVIVARGVELAAGVRSLLPTYINMHGIEHASIDIFDRNIVQLPKQTAAAMKALL